MGAFFIAALCREKLFQTFKNCYDFQLIKICMQNNHRATLPDDQDIENNK